MPWQPLFLSKCRIICVVHFLYSKHKWREEGKIKCYMTIQRKTKERDTFLKDYKYMLYYITSMSMYKITRIKKS